MAIGQQAITNRLIGPPPAPVPVKAKTSGARREEKAEKPL